MRKIPLAIRSFGAIAVVTLVAACDLSESRIPTDPSAFLSGVEIAGPDTLAPGQSALYTATIRLSDGQRKAASPGTNVSWSVTNLLLMRVDASGLGRALDRSGATTLNAEVTFPPTQGGTKRGTKEIVIVPAGTFRLAGAILDDEFPTVPVAGARVEATPGPVAVVTGVDGRYLMFGVPDQATVVVTKAGYQRVEQMLRLTAHATQDFHLPLAGPRLSLSGHYTLTIEAGSACAGGLSAALRRRQYEAVLTQAALDVEVVLTEPRFMVNSLGRGNRFRGRVDAAGATFTLDPYDPDEYRDADPTTFPNVAELLPNGDVVVTQGEVLTTGSAAGLSGQMTGGSFISNWQFFPTNGSFLGSCNFLSPITFTLTPR